MPDLKQFIYTTTPVRPGMLTDGPTDDEERLVSDQADYVQRLTDAGVVLLAGRTQTADYSTFGLCIFLAESDEAARALVAGDPAVKHRVMRGDLFPYRIAFLGDLSGVSV